MRRKKRWNRVRLYKDVHLQPTWLARGGREGDVQRCKDSGAYARRIIVKTHRLFDEARLLLQRLTGFFRLASPFESSGRGRAQDKWCNVKVLSSRQARYRCHWPCGHDKSIVHETKKRRATQIGKHWCEAMARGPTSGLKLVPVVCVLCRGMPNPGLSITR